MARMSNLIGESIKDRLKEVMSKPKRRMITSEIIASSDDYREAMCKELRWLEQQERQTQLVPVLMLFGEPRRVLDKDEAADYAALGGKIVYYPRHEVKSLIK